MGAADLAGEAALEHAGHVGGGDAAAVVAHLKHRAASGGAGLLLADGEGEGGGAVLRRVGDHLSQDEHEPGLVGQHRQGVGNVKGGGAAFLDEEAAVALAGFPRRIGQIHFADGVVALDRGGSRVIEGLVHLGLDAFQLAGHFGRLGPGVVGEHELDGGDGGLYLVNPQLHIAAIGGRVVA